VAFDDDHSAASLAEERGEHAADRPAADDGDVELGLELELELVGGGGQRGLLIRGA
jgi:hypothetical protein